MTMNKNESALVYIYSSALTSYLLFAALRGTPAVREHEQLAQAQGLAQPKPENLKPLAELAAVAENNEGETVVADNKNPITNAIKAVAPDAQEAAWRTAGSQFVKLAREPLVGLLTRHLAPGDEAMRGKIAAFLETELGTALLASMLSATLSTLPQTTGDAPQRLARELRVKAMADAGDVLADVLMGPLRQVMMLYLQDPGGGMLAGAAPALPDGSNTAPAIAVESKEKTNA